MVLYMHPSGWFFHLFFTALCLFTTSKSLSETEAQPTVKTLHFLYSLSVKHAILFYRGRNSSLVYFSPKIHAQFCNSITY